LWGCYSAHSSQNPPNNNRGKAGRIFGNVPYITTLILARQQKCAADNNPKKPVNFSELCAG
ncbi:hypothetical protein, partial [Gemmiger sp.]|uniref:hypothetical protein n=1 Tax=Gemmiger sp. TaxID=2049027 RepID=UPI00307CF2BF